MQGNKKVIKDLKLFQRSLTVTLTGSTNDMTFLFCFPGPHPLEGMNEYIMPN